MIFFSSFSLILLLIIYLQYRTTVLGNKITEIVFIKNSILSMRREEAYLPVIKED